MLLNEEVTVTFVSDLVAIDRAQVSRILKDASLAQDKQPVQLASAVRAIIAHYREREAAGRDLEKEKTRLTAAQAHIAELELAVKRNEQVGVAEAKEVIQQILQILKQRLEQLPDQAAIQVMGCNSTGEVKEKLSVICRQCLSEMHSMQILKQFGEEEKE